jgi:hypothetical protein
MQQSYDIIGDIHGQAGKLDALLRVLGYRESAGAWRHVDRQAVFVGDFIDRGPEQVRSVSIVRRMIDAGAALAVMGNHELNAIAWHTPDPDHPGEYLRPHSSVRWGTKNHDQHAAFLEEVKDKPLVHAELIDWFLTLPLWLDLPGIRIVHACWHPAFLSWLEPRLHRSRFLTRELMPAAATEPADESEKDDSTPSLFKAVEALTKGIEVPLPNGRSYPDRDGHSRTRVRVKWWDAGATTYRTAAMLSAPERATLPDDPLPAHAIVPHDETPVIFGHYWLTGDVVLQSAHATCVDYSAGKGGPLVAYRFDGERKLSADKFVWVP